ncbi:hypothetical protein T310_4326 [Rasamsonia emersonii CBS 393.64]|uniref:Uncharacterized protein n=1 Tax=Rasamsonia emersonii (strain ATCC 16479 / CBS 393.64 / IMI 116815) TaxID=1408163 RepID=A0A0F4YTQ5_RASE3|nr:hypothetical protein T310_4326 [Rasamsonia emersonii CBS 393.64]KKA21647.1 hypothetical protein T310_4326 [Rasamsonia emersonii CBS 393.64]
MEIEVKYLTGKIAGENGHNGPNQVEKDDHSQQVMSRPGIPHGQAKQGEQKAVGLQKAQHGRQEGAANWANVVARSPPNKTVEKAAFPGAASNGNIPAMKQPSLNGIGHSPSMPIEGIPEEGKAGIVHVHGKTAGNFVRFASAHIHEGPIYEIRVDGPTKATIIFQHLLHAQFFMDRNQDSIAATGKSCFGSGYKLTLGEPFEWHVSLGRMNHPLRERRRLTFAKAKLFGEGLTPEKWEREVATLAGPGNLEFTWIFNSGNGTDTCTSLSPATAVFRSTTVARRVLATFLAWKTHRQVYYNLEVSYSTDPCEKELVLTTQMRPGRYRAPRA